jgi:hypothetical protein
LIIESSFDIVKLEFFGLLILEKVGYAGRNGLILAENSEIGTKIRQIAT